MIWMLILKSFPPHHETRKELQESFDTLDLEVTILDIEVLDQQSDRILLRADFNKPL